MEWYTLEVRTDSSSPALYNGLSVPSVNSGRSMNDLPTTIYDCWPDPLITLTNASKVILPNYDTDGPITTAPLTFAAC